MVMRYICTICCISLAFLAGKAKDEKDLEIWPKRQSATERSRGKFSARAYPRPLSGVWGQADLAELESGGAHVLTAVLKEHDAKNQGKAACRHRR